MTNTGKLFSAFFFLFCISVNSLFAQWYNPDKVNKKAGLVYGEAYEQAVNRNYPTALTLLEKALSLDPKFVDVYLSRAGIHAEMHDYKSSVADFDKGFEMDPVYANTYLLPYSISLAGTGNFVKALVMVNKFLEKPTLNEQSKKAGAYRKASYEFAIDYANKYKDSGYIFSPVNMGDSINSAALEYFPSMTIDGKKIIFTRRIKSDEDFYESNLVDNTWTNATPVKGRINTTLNEGAQNVSQDGDWFIFTGCNYPEGAGSCDLYIAFKNKQGRWTEPVNMGNVINTEFWESSPSLSPDKKDLYFSSSRPGGYGGKDIWVTHRSNKGSWSQPENLGPTINTSADEGCPFMHADNETLYFNSDGHMGYGSTDLFYAKKLAENKWATPVNLGYPINTIDDEGSLIVSADGKTGVYASDSKDTKGGLDLFTFTLPKYIQANRTIWVKGQVFDNKTKLGLPSSVELKNIADNSLSTNVQTDEDGHYLITLPVGKEYAFSVNRRNYLFYSDNFNLIQPIEDTFLTINIGLQPIEKGAKVILKNIFFAVNESTLQKESLPELDRLISLLQENLQVKITISGHTDNVGKPADNLALSKKRAQSVLNYLTEKGIAAARLSALGFGESKPVASNATEEGKAQNRRTEILVD